MLPDRVSHPGPLTYESGALPIALRGPACSHGILFSLNIFYFQNCTLQHINNTITQRNRIGTKAYSLYSSSPEHV